MAIQTNNLQTIKEISEAQFQLVEQVLQRGLELFEKSEAEVSLILVDNEYIRELNRDYRGLDQPTDVLSFAIQEGADEEIGPMPEGVPELLGDIFISVERTIEQAESYGHSVERELCYLAVHGLLHLLGYDHQDPEGTAAMRQQEERVLAEFALVRPGEGGL